MKALIVTKNPKLAGGVSNFYRIFFKNYDYKDIKIELFIQGLSKPQKIGQIAEYFLKNIIDIFKFTLKLIMDKEIKAIHLNPSFFTLPVLRDIPFIVVSKLFRKRVIILFHGWDPAYKKKMEKSFFKRFFIKIYSKASKTYVLAEDFKRDLENMGLRNVYVAKTFFDGELFDERIWKKNEPPILLYMGRMQEGKGIFIILDALKTLKDSGIKFHMRFAGWFVDDTEKNKFHQMISKHGLENEVSFIGYIEGKVKIARLYETDFFIYPSFYTEGCPTVVIESLASGCFVISTDVAALKEVIKEGINGYIVIQRDPKDLTNKLSKALIDYNEIFKRMPGIRKDAFSLYESRKIIGQFHDAYLSIIEAH